MMIEQLSLPLESVNEEWRSVPGWEGLYDVSNHGRVRSWMKSGGRGKNGIKGGRTRLDKPIVKDLTLHHTGYLIVTLYDGSLRKTQYRVQVLVLRTFKGEPLPGQEAAHWDGDPTNNHHTNLRWATRKENAADRARHGTQLKGSLIALSKLTEDQIPEIRAASAAGESGLSIARRYGLHATAVYSILRGKTWRHVG